MADLYQYVTQYPTVEFVGGTQQRNVTAVGYTSKPHGVYFEVRIPEKGYTAMQANAAALGMANIIETLFTVPGVAGVLWGQADNGSGLLVDQLTITVESTSGEGAANLAPINVTDLGPKLDAPRIAALRAQLDETEAA